MGDVSLAAALHPVARWSVGLASNLPVASASILAPPYGSASASATTMGGELAYTLGEDSWLLHPDVALGAAAVLLRVESTTAAPQLRANANVWMAAALARGGVALALTNDWRVRADATLGVTFPEGTVELVERQVAATWGRPVFAGGVSLEARLR